MLFLEKHYHYSRLEFCSRACLETLSKFWIFKEFLES